MLISSFDKLIFLDTFSRGCNNFSVFVTLITILNNWAFFSKLYLHIFIFIKTNCELICCQELKHILIFESFVRLFVQRNTAVVLLCPSIWTTFKSILVKIEFQTPFFADLSYRKLMRVEIIISKSSVFNIKIKWNFKPQFFC